MNFYSIVINLNDIKSYVILSLVVAILALSFLIYFTSIINKISVYDTIKFMWRKAGQKVVKSVLGIWK